MLFERALGRAQVDHPALAGLACLDVSNSAATSPSPAPDAGKVAAGMSALVAELIELLGRIVGLELAVRLVDHVGASSRQGAVKGSM